MKKNLMNSIITSRAACLAELISNPKSFFNCPDLHGGCDSPRLAGLRQPGKSGIDVNAAATMEARIGVTSKLFTGSWELEAGSLEAGSLELGARR
jgi:hypothetical protein